MALKILGDCLKRRPRAALGALPKVS
jgi:hypothetical protein